MLTLQIMNSDSIGVMNCLTQRGLCSLSALVVKGFDGAIHVDHCP